MKKSVKRLACAALSLMMASALAVEYGLEVAKDSAVANAATSTTTNSDAKLKNVTGQFDTSKLVEENFNDSVLRAEDVAPKYETRTVMVTLSGKPLADRAKGESVSEYVQSFAGSMAAIDVANEQTEFLQALTKKGIPYTLERNYDTVINAVAIEVDTKYVKDIKEMAGVKSAVITTAYAEPKTVENYAVGSGVVTNETDVYKTGIYDSSAYAAQYGEGTVVAVLDTGLDYTHGAFQRFESENVDVAWTQDYVLGKLNGNVDLEAEKRSGSLNVNEVYVSEKVPFAYDYADDDPDVYPSYSNHGTHVAGIIGGYDTSGYTDKDGNPIYETFKGVVPDCQLVICKVFTDDLDDPDLGGAVAEDIVAALEDCVTLGVDVINMSLGTSCGFTTTNDGDDEGEMLDAVYKRIEKAGISLICAASNDYSAGYGGVFGTNLASNPDSGTVGSPSTFAGALSVASINGQKADYMIANKGTDNESYVFYEESRDIDGNPFDFCGDLTANYNTNTFEYVVVPGVGHAADYTSTIKKLFKDGTTNYNRIALIKRGDTTFQEKVELAMSMGAAGVIVYNNVAGVIRMNLGEIENPIPSVSVTMNAGNALVAGAVGRVGKIELSEEYAAGPFMSEFSSWGPTHDLKLKPEITAHGGEITSAVPGGYGEQSGTSMATPNMAGFMALVRSYLKNDHADLVTTDGEIDYVKVNRLAMQLTMSTAGTVYDQDGLPYSPRKQGAGVAKLENVIGGTSAYLWTEVRDGEGQIINDYRPKIELGDDKDKAGVYTLTFKVTNFGDSKLTFNPEHIVMTETLASDGLAVSEQAHLLEQTQTFWSVDGSSLAEGASVEVGAGETKTISVYMTLGVDDRQYIETSFKNGMYVEGFLKLNATDEGQCDLTIPFLGFYGDWTQSPMLDYSAFEVAKEAQDASIKDEDKIRASVWETLPYNSYYNETYILPMGGYVYLLPDDEDPMYVDEEHCSVSRYNDNNDFSTELDDYMTSTAIKAVYAGLLKNARLVRYSLYNVETGEVIIENEEIYRIGKAYSGGGQAVPANVELELSPEQYGLVGNGKYKMEFEFFQNYPEEGEKAKEDDRYEFTFTVDYEAPILEDARIRYYNYKEGTKEKQRVYLDLDVYDNHYPQAVMLCYPKSETVDGVNNILLQLATEYPTPVRKAVRNGTTTVSIEITDIYKDYFENTTTPMYIQVDDYAVNSCLYELNVTAAKADVLPEAGEFKLAEGEDNITLDVYGTHKVALEFTDSYEGEADLSNFNWRSSRPTVAIVRNGEIVGLRAGTAVITVDNGRNATQKINVTVGDKQSSTYPSVPTVSFGPIKTDVDALVKAEGVVPVNAGKKFTLTIETDPWYYPHTKNWQNIRFVFESTNPRVATVDETTGEVTTLTKGTAGINAKMQRKNEGGQWENTAYGASVTLKVQNEFTVSNYTLTKYNGWGGDVVIPDDMNIWYIAEDAFKDNDNIRSIVIPASVIDIHEYAFQNCTALEEVYFVSKDHRVDENGNINPEIDWAKLSMIYEYAFYGCSNLKKIDLSNVKTITVAHYAFAGCSKLEEVVDMPSIGTMHHGAFAGTAIKSADLTGLHMSGDSVFMGCTNLTEIKTGKFTAIGNYMFDGCTGLTGTVTLHTPKIGTSAFRNCTNLAGVVFESLDGEKLSFDIGVGAFENCGKDVGSFTVDFGGETIRTIGDRAFVNTPITTLDFSKVQGLQYLGGDVFSGTAITSVVLGDGIDFEKVQLSGAPFVGKTVSVAQGSSKYIEDNGVIYNADKTKILYVNESVTGEFAVPETVTEIAPYAFANSKLTSVTLHDGVHTIGKYAFMRAALTDINFNGTTIKRIEEGTFLGVKCSEIMLPVSVGYVGDKAFAESAITSFIGYGVQELGNQVFNACANLEAVDISGVATMGDMVFANCTSLETLAFGSIQEMGYYTFRGSAIKTVEFGFNATTVGKYTFAGTQIEIVGFSDNYITTIEMGAFYNARNLQTITLPDSVTTIEDFAFEGTSSLREINLENVVSFGRQAFYNSIVNTLTLTSAKYIGDFAFATQDSSAGGAGNYDSVEMPVVEEIGAHAFLNNSMFSVEIPASLKKLGAGAFGSADSLKTVTVAEDNDNFFVPQGHENVLYRYVDKATGAYEIMLYPAARVNESKTYAILEGTVRVDAYAFYGLKEGALEKVTLPYSINTIGDAAFFMSGVTDFTFESIQAPALEAVWREEIQTALANGAEMPYRGYYYANFETYLYNYSSFVKEPSPLTIHYPSNGKGYTNHVYNLYFGTKNVMGALMEDNTRLCVKTIEGMYDVHAIESWMNWEVNDENKAIVEAFSETVKNTRLLYNNAMKDETQIPFISEKHERKLLDVETALRAVKAKFGVLVKVSEIKLSEETAHKSEYKVGDTFDTTGLVITVVYDDYSLDTITGDEVTLITGKLTKYTKYIEVSYEGKKTRIAVSVLTEVTPPETDDSSSDETSDSSDVDSGETDSSSSTAPIVVPVKKKGCRGVVGGMTCGIIALGACAILLFKKKED